MTEQEARAIVASGNRVGKTSGIVGALEAIANNMPVIVSALARAWTLEEEAIWQAIEELGIEHLKMLEPKPEPEPEPETLDVERAFGAVTGNLYLAMLERGRTLDEQGQRKAPEPKPETWRDRAIREPML